MPNLVPPEWVFKALFWVIATVMGLWVLWQLYQLARPYLGLERIQRGKPANLNQQVNEKRTPAQWLQRSRTFAQQGNYREACRALYQAMLQKLDQQQLIPDQASRTDGEYLRIVQTFANPRPYQVLFRTHERICFSDVEVSEQTFADCDRAYQETETA